MLWLFSFFGQSLHETEKALHGKTMIILLLKNEK